MKRDVDRSDEAILKRVKAARAEISGLCSGKRKFTMCVPVQFDTDSDMVLSAPLDDIEYLLQQKEYRQMEAIADSR